jgi:hypothetical protein
MGRHLCRPLGSERREARVSMAPKNGDNTHDPDRCLRIYYFGDDETRQVVVGSLPRTSQGAGDLEDSCWRLTGPQNCRTENSGSSGRPILRSPFSVVALADFNLANLRIFRDNSGGQDFSEKNRGLAGGGGSPLRTRLWPRIPCLAGNYREICQFWRRE